MQKEININRHYGEEDFEKIFIQWIQYKEIKDFSLLEGERKKGAPLNEEEKE